MEKYEEQRLPLEYEIYAAIGISIIVSSAVGVLWLILSHFEINLRQMSSFFAAYRVLLIIATPLLIVPLAILAELLVKRWKERRLLWKNILGILGMFSIFMLATLPLLTVSDLVFSELGLLLQIPLAVLYSSMGLIIMGMATRTKAFKKWLKM
jgi:hypothetical protein